MKEILITGASRGLGLALTKIALKNGFVVEGWSRRPPQIDLGEAFRFQSGDLASHESQRELAEYLSVVQFSKIMFVAGGGPYALYGDREWKDHEWAIQLSFVSIARALHALARAKNFPQVLTVGSAVAESSADPRAASYTSAKHALKGLVETLQVEYPSWDLRHLSPGYMDTDLLPKGAAPRAKVIWGPKDVAKLTWDWLKDPSAKRQYRL